MQPGGGTGELNWQGEKQEILKNEQTGSLAAYESDNKKLFLRSEDDSPSPGGVLQRNNVFINNCVKINKSGLAFISFTLFPVIELEHTNKDYSRPFLHITAYDFGNADTSNGVTAVSNIGFFTTTIGDSTNLIDKVNASSSSTSSDFYEVKSDITDIHIHLNVPIPWGRYTLSGFVAKDDSICFASQIYASATSKTANLLVLNNDLSGTYKFTITDCTVY